MSTGGEMTVEKTCSVCRQSLPPEAFHRDRAKPDGLKTRCRACTRDYYLANRARILERVTAYQAVHREEIRAQKRAYRAAHLGEARARERVYDATHREQRREQERARRARLRAQRQTD